MLGCLLQLEWSSWSLVIGHWSSDHLVFEVYRDLPARSVFHSRG